MARITGAYNRRKRKTKKPVTTSKGRANRQKVSKAEVSDGNNRKPTGTAKVTRGGERARVKTPRKSFAIGGDTGRRGGTNQPSTVKSKVPTQGRPKVSKVGGQIKVKAGGMKTSSNNLRARGTAALAVALAAGTLRNPISKAKSKESKKNAQKSIGKFNTRDADGTVRSRKKVGPKKVGPKKVGTIAESFDKAFAAAKKAGKKEFTFRGKRYNTKMT
tara:strand:+ start:569 stop:1219 length:651 start_codon:yes stop_codon:yes gene_type:complete